MTKISPNPSLRKREKTKRNIEEVNINKIKNNRVRRLLYYGRHGQIKSR
jgi:hypothetical protein